MSTVQRIKDKGYPTTGHSRHTGREEVQIVLLVHRRSWAVTVTPRPRYHRERAPVPHCTGGCVGLRADLDGHGEKRISYSQQDSNRGQSILASRYRAVKYV